jgi:orotate phosphoribosyltransferase-like protein
MAKITAEAKAEIIELRRNGETLRGIAEKYNLTGERVRQIVKKYNHTAESPVEVCRGMRSCSPKIVERRQQVAELRKSGMTLAEIAEKLGIPKHTAVQDCRILLKSGVLSPNPAND